MRKLDAETQATTKFSIFITTIRRKDSSFGSIQWHYHPLPITGHFHNGGTTYLNSGNVSEILAKKIIDRNWFHHASDLAFIPSDLTLIAFEQWILFDFANQSTKSGSIDQPDLSGGRYGNWEHATKSWVPYHPDHDDYQNWKYEAMDCKMFKHARENP